MKKIILPSDFSENAWNAIFTALKLYANTTCHFYLLNAYEPGVLKPLGTKGHQRLDVIYDSLSKNSEKKLSEILKYLEINHKNPKHSFETVAKENTLEEAIKKVSTEEDIDLIVMGTQGATGAKQVFLGSNTVKVLNRIKNIPILAVPDSFNFQELKNIIFSTDFMRTYDKYEFEPLLELARLWNSKIEIVHVSEEFKLNEKQQAQKDILEHRFSEFDYSFQDLPFKSSTAYTIGLHVSNRKSDILGIIRHQHTFWEKVIGEPVVKKIAFHSTIPVLFLPEK